MKQVQPEQTQRNATIKQSLDGVDALTNKNVSELTVRAFYNYLLSMERRLYREIEALKALDDFVEKGYSMPQLRRSAMSPSAVLKLLEIIKETQPKSIAEFGSGSSTAYIACYLKNNAPETKFYSFDHLETFYNQTRMILERLGVTNQVTLKKVDLINVTEQDVFYDLTPAKIPFKSLDLAIVDGPPSKSSKLARFGACHALKETLKPGGLIFLDDYARKSEQEIVKIWIKEGSVEVERKFAQLETQAVLLRFKG